jgi:hypothetical protein
MYWIKLGRAHAELARALRDHLGRLRLCDLLLKRQPLLGERGRRILQPDDLEGTLGKRGADDERGDEGAAQQAAKQQHERHPVRPGGRLLGYRGRRRQRRLVRLA